MPAGPRGFIFCATRSRFWGGGWRREEMLDGKPWGEWVSAGLPMTDDRLPVSRMQAGSVNSPDHSRDKSENPFEEMGGESQNLV